MKKIVLLAAVVASSLFANTPAEQTEAVKENVVVEEKNIVLNNNNAITLSVIGQGVAPEHTISNYQALALAKKAAIADAYRMLAEKLNGVKVEGYDVVKNMVIQRSQVKTCVSSMIRHANIVETKCAKDFCEVEMELKVIGNKWYPELVSSYK
jgi:hypothetical protein